MPRAKKPAQPETTAQQLGSIVKSARQIMRKDKRVSGELDRLPILTWVMFLKFLDDLEQRHHRTTRCRCSPASAAADPSRSTLCRDCLD
jgi:type I restriction enzyme M protein